MFCQKCGNQLEADAKFCMKCGSSTSSDFVNQPSNSESTQTPNTDYQTQPTQSPVSNPSFSSSNNTSNSISIKTLAIAIAVIVGIGAIIWVYMENDKNKAALQDYQKKVESLEQEVEKEKDKGFLDYVFGE